MHASTVLYVYAGGRTHLDHGVVFEAGGYILRLVSVNPAQSEPAPPRRHTAIESVDDLRYRAAIKSLDYGREGATNLKVHGWTTKEKARACASASSPTVRVFIIISYVILRSFLPALTYLKLKILLKALNKQARANNSNRLYWSLTILLS